MNTYSTQIVPNGIYDWTGKGAWSSDKARGGGAWIVDEYVPGQYVSHKPNPAYKKIFGIPYADKMILKILVASSAANLQAFIAKQVFGLSIPPGQLPAVQKGRPDAKLNLDAYAPTNTNALFMNTTQKPFDDVRVRRAISMAVDRDGWGKTLQFPYKLESGPITWGFPDYKLDLAKMAPDVQAWAKFNPAEATKLMQAAGVNSSTPYTIHMYPYNETYTPEATFLIDSLAKVGMKSNLKVYDYNNWIANVYYTTNPQAYSGMLYGPDNLDRYQQQLYDRFSKTSNRNHAFISDPQMQQWLTDFSSAKGAAEAQPISNKIQERSVDQAFAVYRPQPTSPLAWDPSVKNYEGQVAFSYQTTFRDAFLWFA
jgi:ABC-type transport system substrate-binding protein